MMSTKSVLRFSVIFVALAVILGNTLGNAATPSRSAFAYSAGQYDQSVIPTPTAPAPRAPDPGWQDHLDQIDCAQAQALQLEKQAGLRAALVRLNCGLERPSDGAVLEAPDGSRNKPMAPHAFSDYGGTDVQVNDALADTYPNVFQTDTRIATKGSVIVVAYDSSSTAPGNYSGVAYSIDHGQSFSEIRPSPFTSGHGTNYGEPAVLYNSKNAQFYAAWLVSGGDCSSQGIGLWTSGDGHSWSVGACVHSGTSDDSLQAWVDNSPSSPYFGRMYVAWNDFSTAPGKLVLSYSDNGTTWSGPAILADAEYRRPMQITGGTDGKVYVIARFENGGGANPATNYVYYSPDGGATQVSYPAGPAYTPAGDTNCSYFRAVSPNWKNVFWVSAGVGPQGVIHLVYAAADVGDTGNIYYTRSVDNALTWSVPIKLNTDVGNRAQWLPSVVVTPNGHVVVKWYDRRNTLNNDYEIFMRVSLDNGQVWQADEPLSDQIIPQALSVDPSVQACYAGIGDVGAFDGDNAYMTWTDGRIQINSTNQLDVYFDKVDLSKAVASCTLEGMRQWTSVAALPVDVFGAAVASDGGFVYAAGGYSFSAGGAQDLFARYDPIRNAWTPLATLPVKLYDALGVYANGKIYVFGGLDSGLNALNSTYIYDISSNTWGSGTAMPGVRQQMGGGYYNGKIYIVGGYTSDDVSTAQNQTWEYNVNLGSWTTRAPMPAGLGGPATAVAGSTLYVIGGRDEVSFQLNTNYAYNIVGNSWSTRAPMPVAANVPGGAFYGGKIWVLGGGTPFLSRYRTSPNESMSPGTPEAVESLGYAQIYNPLTDSWSAGPDQLYPRSFQGAAVARSMLVSVGGYDVASVSITEVLNQRPLNILIAYADPSEPFTLRNALLGLPGVGRADLFDASSATPTLEQLRLYDLVVTFSNIPYQDPAAFGDVLADYQDAGGVVVTLSFAYYGNPFGMQGRWISGGYTPFNTPALNNFVTASLGTVHMPISGLMPGVGGFSAYFRETATLSAGAIQIADWSDGQPAIAVKGRAVGVTGYFGDYAGGWSGNIARLIANAGFSMRASHNVCGLVYLPLLQKH
jgi:N-acetylneuraminic acid mutarotase